MQKGHEAFGECLQNNGFSYSPQCHRNFKGQSPELKHSTSIYKGSSETEPEGAANSKSLLGFELRNSLEVGNPLSLPEVLISPELGFAGRFRWILEIPRDRRFRRCRARVRRLRARCCWNLPSSLPC
ncbi:hypothetical protein Dimus_002999 [Dionaea muscipula]